jgi:hypothetical protein
MSKKSRFTPSILAVFLFLALSSGVAQAASVACSGDFITTDVKLEANFTCPPDVDGFAIGADNLTIDLNGFTVTGSGTSSGFLTSNLIMSRSRMEHSLGSRMESGPIFMPII